MRVSLLCSNARHPVVPYLQKWVAANAEHHEAELVTRIADVTGGDILFLISCSEKVLKTDREKYSKTLVLHASDLPAGRGWSPHVWDIIEGADHVTLTLLEAEDVIDSGKIWKKQRIAVPKHALWNEINHLLFEAEISLIDFAVAALESIEPREQDPAIVPSYRRRRTPADSRLDPEKSIVEQFDLLRMCDPERYPAFFEHLGHRYTIRLEKADE